MHQLAKAAFAASAGIASVVSAQECTPERIAAFGSGALHADAAGDVAYLAQSSGQVVVLDIADAGSPATLSTYVTEGSARRVSLRGSLLGVVSGASTVHIVDVADPADPVALCVETLGQLGEITDIDLGDGIAYVLADSGLTTLDIGDPGDPTILATEPALTGGEAVVDDGLAVVRGDSCPAYIEIIDVSDPANPAEMYQDYVGPDTCGGGGSDVHVARSIAMEGDDLLVVVRSINDGCCGGPAYLDTVYRLDVSDPASPVVTGGATSFEHGFLGLHLEDGIAVASMDDVEPEFDQGLAVFELGVGGSVGLIGTGAGDGGTGNAVRVGDRAIIASPVFGYEAYDVGDLSAPASLDASWPILRARAVTIDGGLAYVGGIGATAIVDVSDPGAPTVLSTIDQNVQKNIEIDGDRAYLGDFGATIFDVSDPASPVMLGGIFTLAQGGLHVDGADRVYVTDTEGLHVYDATDPASPVLLGSYEASFLEFYTEVVVRDGIAYVSGMQFNTLVTIDVSDPSDPTLIGQSGAEGPVSHVELRGDHAYASSIGGDMRIFDVSDPANPTFIGDTNALANDVALGEQESIVYVASSYAEDVFGVSAVNVSDPANPVVAASLALPGEESARGVGAMGGGAVLIAKDEDGAFIVDFAGCFDCEADVNGDGQLSVLDFIAFQNLFVAGDDGADCNDDGELSVLDFVCYQNLFQAGCP